MASCITELFALTISDLPAWATVFLTAVIACSTIIYVRLTARLWTETKRSAEAVTVAALAAKKSAEVAAALYRPFMGLSLVTHKSGWGTDSWEIVFVLKNYGTMPAVSVGMMADFFADDTRFAQITEPTALEFFPTAELEYPVRISPQAHRVPIQTGAKKLRIHVRVPYRSEDGRTFEHAAEVSYAEGPPGGPFPYMPGRFAIDSSQTSPIDQDRS